jgi:predicted nucleic acid-binding protein
MYVLDTDVLSIAHPASGFSAPQGQAWRDWVRRNEAGLYFSTVTIMEVRFGIERARARGASQKAAQLARWLVALETAHRDRIIPITSEIAHKAGAMLARAVAAGAAPGSEDAFIAASAQVLDFTVLSRNARQMRALTDRWLNPLEVLPPDVPPYP